MGVFILSPSMFSSGEANKTCFLQQRKPCLVFQHCLIKAAFLFTGTGRKSTCVLQRRAYACSIQGHFIKADLENDNEIMQLPRSRQKKKSTDRMGQHTEEKGVEC